MKQGLLFKDAPEPRFELYCDNYYEDGEAHQRCNIIFDTPQEFEKHKLDVHDLIPGGWKNSKWLNRDRSWYHKEYPDKHPGDFVQLRFQLPLRPTRRFKVTKEMLENIGGCIPGTKKCWCGKLKKDWDSKHFQTYCSNEHRDQWWVLTDYVGPHKDKYLRTIKACEICGVKNSFTWGGGNLEVDHIIAIVLGGHPWDTRNLQAICEDCHKKKTKSDVSILAWWKRQAKYDIGPIIPDPQLTLDDELNYNYANF